MHGRRPQLLSPLKWHGGKSKLARRIVACFPQHEYYVEPYFGGGNVLLNKPRCHLEVVNDIDPKLAMFWSVISGYRCDPRSFSNFMESIRKTKYDELTFKQAKHWIEHPPWPLEVIDRASFAAYYLKYNRMSRGGLGKDFGWSDRLRGKKNPGGMIPGDVNAWQSMVSDLHRVHVRMVGVSVGCRSALDLIRHDWDYRTVIYCDPPYLHSTRKSKEMYDYEMQDIDHMNLLYALQTTDAHFFLSGYHSEMYDYAASQYGWHRIEWKTVNHSSQAKVKGERTEVLWSKNPFPGSMPCS